MCYTQVPFDLHVLGTSPALTLSHDQTLSTKNLFLSKKSRKIILNLSDTNSCGSKKNEFSDSNNFKVQSSLKLDFGNYITT
jgi:hypothetical protein